MKRQSLQKRKRARHLSGKPSVIELFTEAIGYALIMFS